MSFGIERGELAIILGSSGAGKSTVLNILGVYGHEFRRQGHHRRRRHLGLQREATDRLPAQQHQFVFQFYTSANLTAKENVELASELVKNAADPVQTLVDVGLGGRGPVGHGASATGLANASVAPDRCNCRRHRRNWLGQGQNQLSDSWNQLANGKTQLDAAREQLETSKTVLDKVGRRSGNGEQTGITGKLYEQIRGNTTWRSTSTTKPAPNNRTAGTPTMRAQQYQNAVARLDQGSAGVSEQCGQNAQASKQKKQTKLAKRCRRPAKQVADGVTQLIQGQRDIDKAETGNTRANSPNSNAQKPEAEHQISEAERQITLAEEKIDNLTVPAYSVSGRREGLTSQGYCVPHGHRRHRGETGGHLPDLPSTSSRRSSPSAPWDMVDEERTNSGTLKALGYGQRGCDA